MKNLVAVTLVAMMVAAVSAGCAQNKKVPKNSSVADISGPSAPREQMPYAGPLSSAPAAPVYYEPAPAVTQTPPATPGAAGAGGNYRVQKGDTLFSIAKQKYGNGNQWQRIASAHPGLSPATLKAGQTIVIP
jgi:5'-nucleotidase